MICSLWKFKEGLSLENKIFYKFVIIIKIKKTLKILEDEEKNIILKISYNKENEQEFDNFIQIIKLKFD